MQFGKAFEHRGPNSFLSSCPLVILLSFSAFSPPCLRLSPRSNYKPNISITLHSNLDCWYQVFLLSKNFPLLIIPFPNNRNFNIYENSLNLIYHFNKPTTLCIPTSKTLETHCHKELKSEFFFPEHPLKTRVVYSIITQASSFSRAENFSLFPCLNC